MFVIASETAYMMMMNLTMTYVFQHKIIILLTYIFFFVIQYVPQQLSIKANIHTNIHTKGRQIGCMEWELYMIYFKYYCFIM